jgi:hypothetical protein
MKKQEGKTWDQATPKPLSRRTEGGVRAEGDLINPKIDRSLNLEESLSVITAAKKVTSKEIAKLGKIVKRTGGIKGQMKTKIPQPQ